MKLALIVALLGGTASAGPLQIVQTRNEDFVAQVHGIDGLRLDELALEIDGRASNLITPWRLTPWSRSGERVAVTLLVQGTEHWVGNDEIQMLDGPDRHPGALPGLRVALDRLDFEILPPGSRATTATYSDRLRYVAPNTISGAALGPQKDYLGTTGSALSDAIEHAAHDLAAIPGPRRLVLIVLGDGCDDATTGQRHQLHDDLEGHNVELYAVVYKSRSSCDGAPIQELTSNITHVATIEGLATTAHDVLANLDDRSYVQFDGAKLPWDGETHSYILIAGDRRFGPVFRTLPDRSEHSFGGWWWIAIAAGLLAAVAVGVVARRRHLFAGW